MHHLNKKQSKDFKYNKDMWWDCHEGNNPLECSKIHEFAFIFNIFFPKLLSIFPYKVCGKWIKNDSGSRQTINENRRIITIILIIIISISEIFYRIESYSKYEEAKNYIDIRIGNIFLLPILTFLIINSKISRQQIFSFILSSFGVFLICFFLNSIYGNRDFYEDKIIYFSEQMKHLSFSIFSSTALVLSAFIFDNFKRIFCFLFYNGLLCLTISLIFALLRIDHFKEDLEDVFLFSMTSKLTLIDFSILFLSFGYYLSNSLIIYYFSPTHLTITEILSLFLRWIIEILFENKCENEKNTIIIIKIVGFLIIFISSLVYNEILILHFFKCDKNLQNNMNNYRLIEINNKDMLDNVKNENDILLNEILKIILNDLFYQLF